MADSITVKLSPIQSEKHHSAHYAAFCLDALGQLQREVRIPAEMLESSNMPALDREISKMKSRIESCRFRYQKEWMHYIAPTIPTPQKPKRKSIKGPVCKKRDVTKRKGKAKQFPISKMSRERKIQFIVDELGFQF